jgi:hypothetical protein
VRAAAGITTTRAMAPRTAGAWRSALAALSRCKTLFLMSVVVR